MSSKSKEADGITAVPDPPAPEEEEAPPPEADPEAEEGDELKPEAAAEEKLPAAAKNPDEFPQKDGIVIELSALPSVSSLLRRLCRICCRTACLWEAGSQSRVGKDRCAGTYCTQTAVIACALTSLYVSQQTSSPLRNLPWSYLPTITKLLHAQDRSPQAAKLLGNQAPTLPHSQRKCQHD